MIELRIRIYQIQKRDDDKALLSVALQHLGYYQICRFCGGKIDESFYGAVYDGEIDADSVEAVYRNLSRHLPEGFTGHTMFQSDIVEIVDAGNTGARPGFYFANENMTCMYLPDFDAANLGTFRKEETKLVPCYFCGGTPKVIEKPMTGYNCDGCYKYYIECSCGALVSFRGCDTATTRYARTELIRHWNKTKE